LDKIKKVFIDSENYSWGNRVGESGQLFIDLNGTNYILLFFPLGIGDNSADSCLTKFLIKMRYVIQTIYGLKDKAARNLRR
jgi:hypothetical protein